MKKEKIKISILPNAFLRDDGTFDRVEALKLSGRIAGVCYDKEGYDNLVTEPVEKTMRRIDRTLNNGHHSVYDHIYINFNIANIPKILAMVINNEHQYTTSEKSARYTPIESANSIITEKEVELYNKWLNIFKTKIKDAYGHVYGDFKIKTLAQENARYLITVFMPTQMIYTTSLRQINYLASWMQNYLANINTNDEFQVKLADAMQEFIDALDAVNVLEPGLMQNEKKRNLSLFGKNLDQVEEHFSHIYSTTYNGSLAELAQAQRHRTLDYQMEFLQNKEYFVPPILTDDEVLVAEWLRDIKSVSEVIPQGELVRINELGKYEDFILKCKERLCSAAQLEIMEQTKKTLKKYKDALEKQNHYLAQDIVKYSHGARCTFPDFVCTEDCHFKEGKTLTRKL